MALAGQRLKANPGAYSVYCNDGFSLAEQIVERVSGLNFSEFVRENITKPLGLSHTFTPQDDFDRGLMARTFLRGDETPPETLNLIGSGGIYSTARDLLCIRSGFMEFPKQHGTGSFVSGSKGGSCGKGIPVRDVACSKDSLFGYGLG